MKYPNEIFTGMLIIYAIVISKYTCDQTTTLGEEWKIIRQSFCDESQFTKVLRQPKHPQYKLVEIWLGVAKLNLIHPIHWSLGELY